MTSILEEIVHISGTALEAKDRFLLDVVSKNPLAYKRDNGGLLRVKNERYYQFAVFDALSAALPYSLGVEDGWVDLVIHDRELGVPLGIIEMKCWFKDNLEGIDQDIEKLRATNAGSRIMMIFSANPIDQTEKNLQFLSDQLGLDPSGWCKRSFQTLDGKGKKVEFWVAGYPIAASVQQA